MLRTLWFFIGPILAIIIQNAGKVLIDAAARAVRVAATEYESENGNMKRELAFAEIKRDLELKGVEVTDWVINAAIEAAVGRLKKEQNKDNA